MCAGTFRVGHVLRALQLYEQQQSLPIDVVLATYYRQNRALGSKDRQYVGDTIHTLIRHRVLLDSVTDSPTWESRLAAYTDPGVDVLRQNPALPLWTRSSFPQSLFDMLLESCNGNQAAATRLCETLNGPAPVTLRANALLATREQVMAALPPEALARPSALAPYAIHCARRFAAASLPAFRAGWFELQDEGSQLVAALVACRPGDTVLDYCAGAGGKALAMAPRLAGRGLLALHDVRPAALAEARRRLVRAGVQGARTLAAGTELAALRGRADWVLCDVPCSGSGTLRRSTDARHRIDREAVARLVQQQRQVVSTAMAYMRPGGRLVYATCSILRPENEAQVAYFSKELGLRPVSDPLNLAPVPEGHDGYFAVVLERDR
jgi:16S rRNA C967 or C1407 C5-methylase (RsmB/RsmF family)